MYVQTQLRPKSYILETIVHCQQPHCAWKNIRQPQTMMEKDIERHHIDEDQCPTLESAALLPGNKTTLFSLVWPEEGLKKQPQPAGYLLVRPHM
jgi:hypothetical protein